MACYGQSQPVKPATQAGLAQFAIVGAGALRRRLARGNYEQLYRTRMSTLVSLTARSIDFAAGLASAYPSLPAELSERASRISRSLADIRQCLRIQGQPCEATLESRPSPGTPLLSEIESMVSLMPAIFSEENAVDPTLEPLEDAPDSMFASLSPTPSPIPSICATSSVEPSRPCSATSFTFRWTGPISPHR